MPTYKDYYEILGVQRNASDDDIKRAYRNLARRYHPDVVAEKDKREAETRFKEINEAYGVLSDANKRAHYDRFGTADPHFSPGFGGFSGEGISDIFDFFFGGGVGGARRAGPVRGSDLRYDLEVQLIDALTGVEREIGFNRIAPCEVCRGSGSADGQGSVACPDCRGTGELRHARNTPFGQFVTSAPCARCGGTGNVVRNPCKACGGRGRKERSEKVKAKIPAGADNGTRVRYSGLGEAGERGGTPGDLYIYVHVAPHEVFQRDGAELACEIDVSFTQAALGATLEVDALDGQATLKIPAGTQTGATFRIGGRGMPRLRGSGRGDLIVHTRVVVPKKLSRKQRQLLEEFARAGGEELEDRSLLKRVGEVFGNE